MDNCKLGERFRNGRVEWSQEDEDLDISEGRERSEVTLELLTQVANTIMPYLKFTGEASTRGKPVPVLDPQVWYGETGESGKWYELEETGRLPPGKDPQLKGSLARSA